MKGNGNTRRITIGLAAFLSFVFMLLIGAIALAGMGFPDLAGLLISMIPSWSG